MGDTKFPVRLIQTVNGSMIRVDFGPEVDLIAAMEVRGYAFQKLNANPSQRAELQGQPRFAGLNGPMWDGDAIRYEDPHATSVLTDMVPAALPRAMARVIHAPEGAPIRFNFLILEGEYEGCRFAVPPEWQHRMSQNVGAEIRVKFCPDDQFAHPDPVLTPGSTTPLPPFPDRNRYEEKVEAKRERYAERAAAARSEANSRARAAHVIMDGIPMGQPILVGHHSERRHRKDLQRIDTNLRKASEASDKAAHYAHKAESYGTHGVSSDDPEAVRKLREQLAERNETRAAEKLWNRQLKTAARAKAKELGRELTQSDHVALVESLPIPDPIKRSLVSYARAFPWLPQFGNNTQADIRRIEQRIAELERARTQPEREPLKGTLPDKDGKPMGYTVEWNKADNRVQIFFPFRPSDAVCEKLRSRGFKWARSVGAWQRHASEGAWYHARQIVGHKEPTVELRHCDGCDSDHGDVADYVVTHHDATTSKAAYCGDCADLARVDWNGETRSIAPATPDPVEPEHIPGCAMNHCPHYECGPASGYCPDCEEVDNG